MRLIAVSLLLLTTALAGCTTGGEGSASIYVKDAPTDEFSEIHVVFEKVDVHFDGGAGDGDDNATDEDDEEEDDGEWVVLYENNTGMDIDLLAASGDVRAFLGEADLRAGTYAMIRIHTLDAYGIDHDGERHDFTVPSGVMRVPRSFEVVAGEETAITIDYDLDRSLTKAGPTGWKMTPHIGHVEFERVDDDESGEEAAEEGELVDD